jgi:amino acid transporter
VDALISPFGTGYIFTAATARTNYGLSKIGFFPKALAKLTKNGVPVRSIAVNYVLGLVLFLPFPGWQEMVGFIVSCFVISYIIGPISLIALRRVQPDHPRPFRLPAANTIALVAFYACNLLIFWTGWHTVYRMMIAMSIGLVFFVVHCYYSKESLWLKQWKTSWWLLPYFGSMTLISYLGTFGNGLGYLSFGPDFIVIAILTLIIFYLALKLSGKVEPMTLSKDDTPIMPTGV